MKITSLIAPLCAGAVAVGFVGQALGQTYPVTGIIISLPANPDANTANWGAGTSLLTITATGGPRTEGAAASARALVIIKKGGKTVCGSYTSATAPSADFKTATTAWSGRTAASFLGKDCTLPPGDYELSVQFFSGKDGGVPSSREVTKAFSIRGSEQQRTR
jgi:hypothetical protein